MHKTTTLYHRGTPIEIDCGIAPLVSAVWRLGIETHMSCENNVPEGYAWLCFRDRTNLERFLRAVFYHQPHTARVNYWRTQGFTSYRSWLITPVIEPGLSGPNKDLVETVIIRGYSVRFPIDDIEEITRLLEACQPETFRERVSGLCRNFIMVTGRIYSALFYKEF